MDDETVEKAGTGEARWLLEVAQSTMVDLLAAWEDFVRKSKEGNPPKGADFSAASTEMVKLRRQLLDGIKQHEQEVRDQENRTDTAAIDFDARRDEIGRRLARLRAVRDDG